MAGLIVQKMTALARVVYRSSSLYQNCTAVFTEIEKTVLLLIRKHKETLIAAAILSRKSNVQVQKLVSSYSAEPESQKLGLEQSHKQAYKPVLQNIKPGNEIKQVQYLVFYSSPKHALEKKCSIFSKCWLENWMQKNETRSSSLTLQRSHWNSM